MNQIAALHPVLLVVDMQNDFFVSGPLAERRDALCQSINELIAVFRSRNLPVIWVRQEFAEDLSDAFLAMRDSGTRITIRNTPGSALLPELNRSSIDQLIVKRRYSAFFETSLDVELRKLEADLLVIVGVNSHACVRTTAVDAYQRDYRVVIGTDCIGSYDEEYHRESVRYLEASGVSLLRSNEQLASWMIGRV